ncbi:MAG: hypothetical protein COA37_08725 [Hoeflea sp.]|uniref:hypothetical protein n=1 Tax=Hoeflea sp. TaxID=1940281 RepID=UPI000C0DB549|nr:hypothetical protein [Hoeflea sp.]PHR23395.1 MAG: hypothetical protein COA37_08725 [Hoeflea sp.]
MAFGYGLCENAVIVAAHPDDEILWFSSVMRQAQQVIILYRDFWADPGIGARRAEAIRNMPHPDVVWMEMTEAGACGCADWISPKLTESGLGLTSIATLRDFKSRLVKALPISAPAAPLPISQAYAANFRETIERLRPLLRKEMNIFSHNPWGEYGHEDHVQCFRALDVLRQEIGFKLWVSNYCSDRSLPLAQRYLRQQPSKFVRLPTDIAYAREVAKAYKDADCWTWDDGWEWFEDECFVEAPSGPAMQAEQGHLFPLNFFTV